MSNMWLPSVEVDSYGGTRVVPLETRLLMSRRLFITGVIDNNVANSFITELLYLASESDAPITVYIHSPGGEVMAGLLIYDAMQGVNNPISTVCVGMAASMGALILASGRRGCRYIMPHSKVLIHEPLISDMCGGSATSVMNLSKSLMKTRDILSGILSEHTGRSVKEINTALAADSFMNAQKAVEFGLCDHVTDSLFVE